MAQDTRFLCDHMLGSLARWLRFLGYDTLYPGPLDDTALLRSAREEGRVLLTRDKELAARAGRTGHLVRSDALDGQLADIRETFGPDLSVGGLLSRCSLCNAVLVPMDRDEAGKAGVPTPIAKRHRRFWRCPGCAQLYWPGSHHERILGKIGELGKGSGQ
ncbi:MAG: hypothetical protein FJ149_04780 [Euryarchaeota archaeon]|nr:hypothetical protein [Euryarchaeota archaeon]